MSPSLSEELARSAARLVAEEGLDFSAAKRKAARASGRGNVRASDLPSNEAVEEEVRAYLDLFQAESQPRELSALRELALRWMDRLGEFRPHLSGPVWRGTANRLSGIRIDLFCDDPKGAEIALLNEGLDFDVNTSQGDERRDPMDVLSIAQRCPGLDGEEVTLHFVVRDFNDLRGALKPDARGKPLRGDAAALRRLLSEPASP